VAASTSHNTMDVHGLLQGYRFTFFCYPLFSNVIFWDITPCSPLKVNRRFGEPYHLHLQSRRISPARNQRESRWKTQPYSVSYLTLKMEVICSSETSLDFQRTTRLHIPEDRTLHNHRCENLNSSILSSHLIQSREIPDFVTNKALWSHHTGETIYTEVSRKWGGEVI
jgi:hypothetical protein